MNIPRSLLLNSYKYSQGLSSAPRRYYHTTLPHFKWPTQLKNTTRSKWLNERPVKIWEYMTIWDLARSMKKDKSFLDEVIRPSFASQVEGTTQKITDMNAIKKFLVSQGKLFKVINSAPVYTYKINEDFSEQKQRNLHPITKKDNEVKRPPVVTIMGHVDHGKTTLLDALRNSNTVDKEFGGITQHIGAFSVQLGNGKSVTFIDTPGHAAFSAMRNRGANTTDIVVLIVAADDGVMEQTIESIKMANNAGVPLLVAVNKIDKATKSLAEIKDELLHVGVQAEDLGGDVQVVPISALKRVNLDLLVEAILIQADCLTLTGDPKAPVEGIVIESSIGPRGRTATIIVKRGTLRIKTVLLAGKALIRVKAMFDENGRKLTEVSLSQPAQIIGWKDLPHAGDKVVEVESEREGRLLIKEGRKVEMNKKMIEDYATIQEKSLQHHAEFTERKTEILTYKSQGNIERLKEIYSSSNKSSEKPADNLKFSIIVKGDVDGSVDAILNIIDTYDCDDLCKLDLVDFGVGMVTRNDIDLAEAFNATIYCFNLPYPNNLKEDILEKNIKIRFHNIIYQFVQDLKIDINETLPEAEEEEIVGTGQILQHFSINEGRKKIPVAGSICLSGEFNKKCLLRIKRADEVIYDGAIHSLKHFKNEVNTIKKDAQCGIRLLDFENEFKVGDKIVCYKKISVKQYIKWDPGF